MKFRNFLASVMAGCAHGHAGWSLIPSPRLGVPMEIGSKLISGLKCCYVCMLFVFLFYMFPLAWGTRHRPARWSPKAPPCGANGSLPLFTKVEGRGIAHCKMCGETALL